MAEVIWMDSALAQLDAIGHYIAFENPEAADRLVQRVFTATDQLGHFPKSGSRLPEFPKSVYRHLVIKSCRVIYRLDREKVIIVWVMRSEMVLHWAILQ